MKTIFFLLLLSSVAFGQTRFYFDSQSASVTPPYSSDRGSTSDASRKVLAISKQNESVTDGDRLVIEIGYIVQNSGRTPQAQARYGDSTTDLPENNDLVTSGSAWIEFSNTILFLTI